MNVHGANYLSRYSQSDFRLHFGLGDATSVGVELAWPSGRRETLHDLPVNHLLVVREGEGVVSRRAFR